MEQVGHVKDHWTHVDVPARMILDVCKRAEARDWLIDNESTGKFFAGHERYWFEKPEDATMYVLRWS